MEQSLGARITAIRKSKGFTQEELAEKLGVSGQAVSKWENDLTCPDITLLPTIARLGGITVDELLTGESEKKPETVLVPLEERKNIDDMMLRVVVDSSGGDKVRVNLPMALVRVALELGLSLPSVTASVKGLENLDLHQIYELVEKGVLGKLMEVESSDGDIINIFVE